MHQTITSRKAIYIPHTVDVIPLDELASRLAAALFQLKEPSESATQDIEADAAWFVHAKAADRFRYGLIKACEAGQLTARDNVAHMQCSPEEKGALLLVDEAANYLATSGASVRITRHIEALPFIGLHPDELVPLDDVPMLVANAMHDPETDSEWHGLRRLVIEKRIYEAANFGGLVMLDHLTRQRLSIRSTGACVTAGDLSDFFSGGAEKLQPSMAPAPQPASSDWESFIYPSGYELTEEDANEAAAIVDAMRNPEDDFQLSTETISTRKGLLEAHGHEWPTLERDLRDAAVNGLAKAAKAGARGWLNSKALDWARSKGKLTSTNKTHPQQPASVFNVLTHKIKG